MAFVYESDRALEKYNPTIAPPPGTYSLSNEHRSKDNYAPFYTTTLRSSIHNATTVPGPGTYQLRRNIGQPTITTYANKSSIVIRVNSQGSAPFTSQLPRFQSIPSPGPGPGDYELKEEYREKPKRRIPVQKKIVQPQKNAPSITAKTTYLNRRRAKTQQAIRSLRDLQKGQKQLKESVWARNKDVLNEVGPGRYTIDSRKKGVQHRGCSVGFASKTVRTFFDTIMYNTSNERTLESRIQKGYKDQMPGPGSYYDHHPHENDSDKYKNHSFGSSNDRFQKMKSEAFDVPFYSVSEPRKRTKTDPQFRSEVKRSLAVPSEEEIPGPGSYEPYCYKIGKILKVEVGNFGFKAPRRTVLQPQGSDQIGPGSYDPAIQKISETLPSSNFSSQVPRFSRCDKQQDNLGKYDLSQSDISRKILLNRIHRQNLQKINCNKPAFDTQIPRFRHYQSRKIEEGKVTAKQLYLSFVEKHEKQRSRGIEQARNQVPSKKSTISKSRRFETDRGGPGVGEYSLRDKWLKKSYNIKYSNKDP